MYLSECRIQNVGPIDLIDLTLPFDSAGNPKPIVLVGRNGSGKSILLAHLIDGLIEFAKMGFQDIVSGQNGLRSPYFKILGSTNQRTGSTFGLALASFRDGDDSYYYLDKTGHIEDESGLSELSLRFPSAMSAMQASDLKLVTMNEEAAKRIFRENSICSFPSHRYEIPHWSNAELVKNAAAFQIPQNYSDKLYKPIVVETTAESNLPWLLDVFLDSFVDVEQTSIKILKSCHGPFNAMHSP